MAINATSIESKPAGESALDLLKKAVASPAFWPGVILFAGICLTFWPMFRWFPDLWFSKDGYYSHGPLIPLVAGYIIYRRWGKISAIPVQPSNYALIPMVPLLLLLRAANHSEIALVLSFGMLALILFGVWFVAGWRWMLAVSPAVLMLVFALPVWTMAIDIYTNPLQQLSTKVAFAMLKTLGFHPYQSDSTTILLNHFSLDVGVACSGLRMVISITAFTIFFVLIANLKLWANIAMGLMVIPLCLFINGLRIALIGMVGDTWGDAAGHAFHDYSGYIALVICFVILFKVARALGWKD